MRIEGVLVDLVPYGQRFIDQEHRWLNDEGVFWWATGGRWIVTRAEIERERAEGKHDADQRLVFGIQTKDGTPIGLIGVNRWSAYHRTALLTAFIGERAYWGGGYGTDALLLVLEYVFDWLDVRRAWLMTMSLNERVLRQMEKVGFRLEARQREATWVDTGWHDMLTYAMTREEWPGREALVERLGLSARG